MAADLGNVCVCTLGKAGCVVCSEDRTRFIPSKKVCAVESAGAGDSFIGGICYGLIHDMDIFHAADFATCCSVRTVCRTGGQPAMPVLEEVLETYRAQ